MFLIKWWNELSWTVKIWGSKNAVLPIIAACLLIKWKVKLTNVPEIWDVVTFIEILSEIWVKINFSNNILEIDSTEIKHTNFDLEKIKKIRVSILLLSPLLKRVWKISIPNPGWCNLWKRPIEDHLKWLETIWYKYSYNWADIFLEWVSRIWNLVVNAWFWVTVTENLIVANVLREWETTIKMSAIEPHVMNLIDFLRVSWADIKIKYDHTIIINWVSELKSNFDFEIISDYIQSGSYMIIWALASKEFITIQNARVDDLYFFISKLREAWVKVETLENDTVKVYKADDIKVVNIQTNIFPWFPTDLQSPFAILMTKANWMSKIHEILFEWRLNWLVELDKMWAHTTILNPHEAIIFWQEKRLKWAEVTSWDLRAWCAVVIAWLIADWETKVTNIKYIKRGYENFVENLKNLWANIDEILE